MRIPLLCICMGLIFFACKRPAKDTLEARLDRFFSNAFPEEEPGAAVLVMQGDSVLFEHAYGLADLQTRQPITPNTAFNTGSISKTFVSNAILILRQEGRLRLEDSLEQYFPDFKNPEIARKVQIIHLLNHSSGLIDSRRVQEDSVFYLTAKDRENFVPILQNDSTAFEPGSRFAYSNPAYNGLALIIEQITGRRWQDFVIERIFRPSGLTDSKITDGPFPEKGVAHAYVWSEGKYIEDDYGEEPTFPASGNGGVWSSVRDLARYEKAIQTAAFLPASAIAESRKAFQPANWQDKQPSFIGYSWFTGKINGEEIIFHTGSQGGFVADYVWMPSKKLFYTILCNSPRPIEKYREEVFRQLALLNSTF